MRWENRRSIRSWQLEYIYIYITLSLTLRSNALLTKRLSIILVLLAPSLQWSASRGTYCIWFIGLNKRRVFIKSVMSHVMFSHCVKRPLSWFSEANDELSYDLLWLLLFAILSSSPLDLPLSLRLLRKQFIFIWRHSWSGGVEICLLSPRSASLQSNRLGLGFLSTSDFVLSFHSILHSHRISHWGACPCIDYATLQQSVS